MLLHVFSYLTRIMTIVLNITASLIKKLAGEKGQALEGALCACFPPSPKTFTTLRFAKCDLDAALEGLSLCQLHN
jgi:hypothetical protein